MFNKLEKCILIGLRNALDIIVVWLTSDFSLIHKCSKHRAIQYRKMEKSKIGRQIN